MKCRPKLFYSKCLGQKYFRLQKFSGFRKVICNPSNISVGLITLKHISVSALKCNS